MGPSVHQCRLTLPFSDIRAPVRLFVRLSWTADVLVDEGFDGVFTPRKISYHVLPRKQLAVAIYCIDIPVDNVYGDLVIRLLRLQEESHSKVRLWKRVADDEDSCGTPMGVGGLLPKTSNTLVVEVG